MTLKKVLNLKQEMCFGFHLLLDSLLACRVEIKAITVADNVFSHNKMKHVELHAHYLRQLVHDNFVFLEY
jgi:hypothetical protein